jgi:AcrR family transcriptional regulator
MPRRKAAEPVINTPVHTSRKATQRERLLAGMIAAANRAGYAGAYVSEVIAEAGVSRPTFYDYFEGRDDCFIATMVAVDQRLQQQIDDAVASGAPEQALQSAVAATVAFASSHPADARFLMGETLAGGPMALQARDEAIAATAKELERVLKRAGPKAVIPDVPIAAVLGAVQRLVASRLRRGERAFGGLREDLLAWTASYGAPASEHRWRRLKQMPAPPRSPYLSPSTLRAPAPLGPGRPRLSEAEVAENRRQRIIFATAQVVQEHGYTAATVSEITKLAGVDGRAFYELFADKQEAFSAIHELGFQYLMAATAGAFFTGASWPERVWEGFRAATQSVDDTPTFAHLAFVEAYAVGARGIQRVEDSRVAFTIFLQEGYRYQQQGPPPSRLALEAIITTIFEIVYLQARSSTTPKAAGLLGHILHMCLTPFTGAAAANELIAGKLRDGQRQRKGATTAAKKRPAQVRRGS